MVGFGKFWMMLKLSMISKALTCAMRHGLALIFLLFMPLSVGALAQNPETPTEVTSFKDLIDKAKADGVRVIIVDPRQVQKPKAARETDLQSIASRLQSTAYLARDRLSEIFVALPKFPNHALEAIISKSPNKSSFWPIVTLGWTVLFLIAGWCARYLFARWAEGKLLGFFDGTPRSDAEKIGYLYTRAALSLLGLIIQLATAALLVIAFDMGRTHLRSTAMLIIAYWGTIAGFAIFLKNLLAVDVPQYRIIRIGDHQALSFYRNLVGLSAFATLILGLCFWMEFLGIDRRAHVLALGSAQLIVTVFLSGIVIRHRHDVASIFFGYRPKFAWSIWQRLVASLWHVPFIIYFFVAWTVTAVRLLLDQPNAIGLVGQPILFILAAVALYGAYLLFVELMFARTKAPSDPSSESITENAGETVVTGNDNPIQLEPPNYKELAVRSGGLVAIIMVIAATIRLWGIRPFASAGWADVTMDILIVGFIAYVCWSAIRVAIERKLLEEGGPVEIAPGEIGGAGASRLSTLLPLIANFLFIFIMAVAMMVILSEVGVNITALLAGAGVLGLAVGFGAQTLIRDIISGVFFLIDDAFRQGEFIDVGDVKGTVETISLRSMQLRHHLGPLNTIPFGEIKNVQNFSRDWVMMKLPIRLTYDTDAEKVRKLINNYGKELLKDPQVGEDFLQPLKSQGIIQMDESAQIMRVKFMSKPGQQWVIRRKVLNGIRDLFEREGVQFAHHEVTVRLAHEGKPQKLTEEQEKQVIGAAAQRVAALRQTNTEKSKDEL
jgi:moderate conductance mechanosensitive channel